MAEAMSNPLAAGTSICQWNLGHFSSDRALALFEPCRSKSVSHAKWRTDVVYGQGNIVLRCLPCTWWYGADRGICQKQSGVMEGRDKGKGGIEIEGAGERTAWALSNSLQSLSCGGTRTKTCTHPHRRRAERRLSPTANSNQPGDRLKNPLNTPISLCLREDI